jgi:ADP-glucose pyrophosphorylase
MHYLAAVLDISVFVQVLNSIVSHGCFLTECSVEHSVIGIRSRLELGVQLKVSY